MDNSYTVLGAGIVGVCVALALQRDGNAVTLIDRDDPGHGCSFGNAGIIHSGGCVPMATPGNIRSLPRTLFDPESALVIPLCYAPRLMPWLFRMLAESQPKRVEANARALLPLAQAAQAAYAPLLREAGAESVMPARGELYVYRTRRAFEAARWEMDLRRRFGIPVEDLGSEQVRQMEPALSPDYRYAHYQSASSFVTSPLRLVQSLAALFASKGGAIVKSEVRDARPHVAGGAVLLTAAGEMRAENLVICAGAYSKRFAARFGADVPLESWRGYHIVAPQGDIVLNGVVADGEKHIAVTPMEDGLRVAGLLELAGLEAPPNFARTRMFLRLARALIPGFPSEATSRWMGHRPGMPDSRPVIGRAPGRRDVYFAFGHGQLGLTFGAITGQLIADLAAGRPSAIDLHPYRAERF